MISLFTVRGGLVKTIDDKKGEDSKFIPKSFSEMKGSTGWLQLGEIVVRENYDMSSARFQSSFPPTDLRKDVEEALRELMLSLLNVNMPRRGRDTHMAMFPCGKNEDTASINELLKLRMKALGGEERVVGFIEVHGKECDDKKCYLIVLIFQIDDEVKSLFDKG